MQVREFHAWAVTPGEAMQIQEAVRAKVLPRGRVTALRLVAGADAAFDLRANRIYAGIAVLAFPSLEIVETATISREVTFPYVPGLLSFREAPALLQAFTQLMTEPDLIFIDGHGLSHPRKAGIACHIGVLLDRPAIGCAKSLLVGAYREPGSARGSTAELRDKEGTLIGAVVRTRDRVKPVFVSIGHKVGLAEAVRLTLACGKGYRIPEPTRQADLLVERAKRQGEAEDGITGRRG